ncbi:L-dopachrome tautomerase-related protein [Tenacibaculum retecalamus]|uniref:L-dopachrome tautomerase-related protein n=1 Tax=Tenacibaculum retecalamus TaxID=3018315 RepID=UPI0023D944F1|nr:L-dopachrome tautomerase-related protein [Tenacibaculum retecalamus]WBX70031.1 L-dopachrome tautomerase-related protein [Tenacibaculum retecalamus]
MKKVIVLASLGLLFTMCKSPNKKENTEVSKNETEVRTKTNQIKEVETIFSSQDVRPGNLALTSNGRLFVTMSPFVSPTTKVFEISKDGTAKAYPNAEYATGDNSIFKGMVGVRVDSKDNLWLLDITTKQFIVWNTIDEKLEKIIKVPADAVVSTSFLQDFIIDEKHNNVIIADMTQADLTSAPIPAFIVINTETGKARRMAKSHPSMMPSLEGGFALNPIAIDPTFEWLYYGALHGKTVYRVPTSSFESDEKLLSTIEKYAPKSYCDGMAIDANNNIYITNIEESAIGITTKKDGFKNLAMLPEGQSWPDGLYVANDGYIYGTVDQLNRTAALNKGNDISTGSYLVVKIKLVK